MRGGVEHGRDAIAVFLHKIPEGFTIGSIMVASGRTRGQAILSAVEDVNNGQKQVLAVPIAFVTDHVETLYEIDQLFGDEARRAGIAEFRRTPGLNSHPTFLRALVEIVEAQADFWSP